ncbi:LpqB family beta-propeller domain-containing protein [Microbacterium sp. KHB019]|uniref:LpqB family beta-propeller domain-containing protein n=1 Tax=Microbacterium sp. KHB019 TaxID=3129770 RepID=UPI00307A92F0
MAFAALTAVLAGCTSLPSAGEVNVGLVLDDVDLDPDISQIAARPLEGASPAEIVEGFLDAALTPDNGWAIAREFLSPEFAATWRPSAGVTIDSGAGMREFSSDLESDDAETGDVSVVLDLVARVDEDGAYAELPGDESVASFAVAKNDEGEWRITEAADGIVLDAGAFEQVYRQYPLQYFDQSWTHLVPDLRWYPRRQTIATTLTQALLDGSPGEWLAPAVRSAFPGDVSLASDSVPISPEKIATVELTAAAAALDDRQLSRMRTQLEATLRPAGVTEVRLLVNGRDLGAGTAAVETGRAESSPVVLTEDAFGSFVGQEITPYDGISDQIIEVASSVAAVDVAADDSLAAMQFKNGAIYIVEDGQVNQIPTRPGQIAPSIDPYGYTWTVPRASPHDVEAWRSDVTSVKVAEAFPGASSIMQLRVASDGVRLAAVISVGGQRWIALAAITRDDAHAPVALGDVHLVAQIDGTPLALSWIGEDALGVLIQDESAHLVVTQSVGGPGTAAAAPSGALMLSGGRTNSALRILGDEGVLYAQRGTTWQLGLSGVLVLGTHAGQ